MALVVFLGACATPTPPDDGGGVVGTVFIASTDVLLLESFPVQVRLAVSGDLPSPCHELRWSVEDDGDRIAVAVYTVLKLGQVCPQVLTPFDVSIPLGSFTEGRRRVVVNGGEAGEFSI